MELLGCRHLYIGNRAALILNIVIYFIISIIWRNLPFKISYRDRYPDLRTFSSL